MAALCFDTVGDLPKKAQTMQRILVVEDDELIRNVLRRHLGRDYEIIETGDATQALALALEKRPHCILLDLNLPELSGLELCNLFSDLSATRLIPIIVITGQPAAIYKEICEKLGAVDFIEKPLNFEDLKVRLAAALEKKRAEGRAQTRVRLSVSLRLRGANELGDKAELEVTTNEVSSNGFSCPSMASLAKDSLVEVFLTGGKEQHYVGRARVVRIEQPQTARQRYGFQFIEKTGQWIIQ